MSAPSLLSVGNLHHCNVLLESVPDVTSPPLLPSSLHHFLPNPRCKERPTKGTGPGIFFPCLHDVLRAAVTVFSGSFNPVLHVPFGATMKLATTRNEVKESPGRSAFHLQTRGGERRDSARPTRKRGTCRPQTTFTVRVYLARQPTNHCTGTYRPQCVFLVTATREVLNKSSRSFSLTSI